MTYILSMLGSAVLIGCAVQSIRELTGTKRLTWLPAASLMLSFVPLGELSLGRWIHSFSGFLSLPLMVLLAWYSVKPLMFQHVPDHNTLRRYWWLMVIVGSLYFPAAIGLGNFDPHALGWQPGFVWIPIGISLAMLSLGEYWLAAIVLASMLAWQCSWLGTTNGWSYLLDPIAVGFSVFGLVATKLRSVWLDRKSTCVPTENPTTSFAAGSSTAA